MEFANGQGVKKVKVCRLGVVRVPEAALGGMVTLVKIHHHVSGDRQSSFGCRAIQ